MGNSFDVDSFNPLITSGFQNCKEYLSISMGEVIYVHCITPVIGRYVSIYLTGEGVILEVCEVEVYETPGKMHLFMLLL